MQKIVGDRLRPEDKRDPHGVGEARSQIETAYAVADGWMRAGPWAVGEAFTMADCSAAPALFYANTVVPFGERHENLAAYFARLEASPVVRAGHRRGEAVHGALSVAFPA